MTDWGSKKTNCTFFTAVPPEYRIGLKSSEIPYDRDWGTNSKPIRTFHWHGHKKLSTIEKFCEKHNLTLLYVNYNVFKYGYFTTTETIHGHPDLQRGTVKQALSSGVL